MNAAIYWIPGDAEFGPANGWPAEWNATAVAPYTAKLQARLPSKDTGSADGQYYLDQTYQVMGAYLQSIGYTDMVLNDNPNQRDMVYGRIGYYFQNGRRTGPMGTYFRTSKARSNFSYLIDTMVLNVERNGSSITGVRTDNVTLGTDGVFNVAEGGKVVLASGVFGTSRILFRSGELTI